MDTKQIGTDFDSLQDERVELRRDLHRPELCMKYSEHRCSTSMNGCCSTGRRYMWRRFDVLIIKFRFTYLVMTSKV
ncbi:hypothetical protein [Paenibacillus validus]|uniref:Uncharacterized protein n=1 Tax=Paenibacillus validus TaxID=44253 RepID=A0A7X3CQT2_9BACL|nr:hypothetical protein [Paenibacillus validus]MUG69970.1 hypothetical protein [Paenibacillus validus]